MGAVGEQHLGAGHELLPVMLKLSISLTKPAFGTMLETFGFGL